MIGFQKGLFLLLNGWEVVEEGVGFGLVVVKYTDKTFFSIKAEIAMHRTDGASGWLRLSCLTRFGKKVGSKVSQQQ